jgi:acetyl-CoA acetyltransferase
LALCVGSLDLVSLIFEQRLHGLATMCIGGGQGIAVIVERMGG